MKDSTYNRVSAGSPTANGKALIERDFRRNATAIVLFEFFWGLGIPFALFTSMVPAYLTALGSSKTVMGFVQSLWIITAPIQLLASHFFAGRKRVRNAMLIYIVGVGIRLCLDIAAISFPGRLSSAGILWAFVPVVTMYVFFINMGQPLYVGIQTDNFAQESRGKLFGLRTFGFGTAGLTTGFAASWVLKRWVSPLNFQVSFLVGDSVFLLSCFSFILIKDHQNPWVHESRRNFFHSLREKLKSLMANPNYRVFLFFHLLNACATNIAAFIIPYAKEKIGITDSRFAILSIIYLGANVGLGIVLGNLADRFGYKLVGIIQSACLIVFFLIAINAKGLLAVCIAYGFSATVVISLPMVFSNMSVELCPEISPADLTALGSFILLPFIAVMSPLSGSIIDITHSYLSVFLIGATLAVVALMGMLFLVREPRTGRLYEIKQIPLR